VLVLGCGDQDDAGNAEESSVGPGTADDSGSSGNSGASVDDGVDESPGDDAVDEEDDGTTDPTGQDDSTSSPGDEGTSAVDDDEGGGGPTCGGIVWRAEMDVDPTTLEENGDGLPDFEFNGGAFPQDGLADGIWAAAPDTYIRTVPDDPLANRVIVALSMRTTAVGERGALFWANLGQEDDSVTRLWMDVAKTAEGGQVALIGGYSAQDVPEVLLMVEDLGEGFIDVMFDADPDSGEVAVLVAGEDHGTLQLPSYNGSNPQAAAIGALEAAAEIDYVEVESCP
jgi:hypothetical protein